MTQPNMLQIVVIVFLLIVAVLYTLYSGRAEAITLFLGLSIWSLSLALARKLGIEI